MTHKYNIVVIHLRPSLQCRAATDKRFQSGGRAVTPIHVYRLFSSIVTENTIALYGRGKLGRYPLLQLVISDNSFIVDGLVVGGIDSAGLLLIRVTF